jgi:hypothetical protein
MYTVWADYGATGEGITYMVLYTRGDYGNSDNNTENALNEFKDIFGSFYASGACVQEGLHFDFPGIEYLVSDTIRKIMPDYLNRCNQIYYASYHVNCS